MIRSGTGSLIVAALAAAFACVAGCAMSDVHTDSTGGTKTGEAHASTATDSVPPPQAGLAPSTAVGSRVKERHATVRTAGGNYVVRDIVFNTAEGFGGTLALMGHYNGTLWNFELRFVSKLEVIGKIDAAEARYAPDNYFVREDSQLRKTFRTRLTKTDGEVVDFVVRINSIQGTLESGGPLQLSSDELETLKSIEFF